MNKQKKHSKTQWEVSASILHCEKLHNLFGIPQNWANLTFPKVHLNLSVFSKRRSCVRTFKVSWDIYFASILVAFNTVLWCSIFQSAHWKSWDENSTNVYERLLLALPLWFGCSCSTLSYFPLPLYKGKGSWLVIDSTEVFKSDRLKALYIMGRSDGWVRVQGWGLRIQSKAWSILTTLTCRTLTWWADIFFSMH